MFNQTYRNYKKDEEKRSIREDKEIIIMNKREFVSEAIESYKRLRNQNFDASIYEVKTRLSTLFDDIDDAIRENISAEEYSDLVNNLLSNEPALLFDAWKFINSWLYKKGLLKVFKNDVVL